MRVSPPRGKLQSFELQNNYMNTLQNERNMQHSYFVFLLFIRIFSLSRMNELIFDRCN